MIEIPDFMVKPTSALTDPLGQHCLCRIFLRQGCLVKRLPVGWRKRWTSTFRGKRQRRTVKKMPGNGDRGSDEIRQRTVEEKYTNLGEYVPGQADLSPTGNCKNGGFTVT